MRNTFASCITKLAKERDDIVLLSGDIGNRMFDDFKEIAPDRFINCGIAEANMMSLAAGMGISGLKPFVYTITPFTTARCFEQIKIGVAYHNSNVTIVGTGSGLSYAELGPTHHSLEDLGILRTIPSLSIYTPSDCNELKYCINQSVLNNGPSYIRIGKKGEKDLSNFDPFSFSEETNWISKGGEIAIIGYGPILSEAKELENELRRINKNISIISILKFSELGTNFLKELEKNGIKHLIILEEHYSSSGLFSKISELVIRESFKFESIKPFGLKDQFINRLGKQDFIRKKFSIDKKSILEYIKDFL